MTRGKTALALLLLPVSENTTVKGKVGCAWLGWAGLGARVPTVGGCHQPMVEHIWAGLGKCALECGEPSSPAQVTLYGKCAGQGRAGRCGLCGDTCPGAALCIVIMAGPGHSVRGHHHHHHHHCHDGDTGMG